MKNKKGFTLVELMVVVAIIAILAAVALPMYTTFKQKSKVGTVLKALEGARTALQTHFDATNSFASPVLTFDTANGKLEFPKDGDVASVGSAIVAVPGMAWQNIATTAETITFSWVFSGDAGCPTAICDGSWTLSCFADGKAPYVTADIGDGSLGLNIVPVGPDGQPVTY